MKNMKFDLSLWDITYLRKYQKYESDKYVWKIVISVKI